MATWTFTVSDTYAERAGDRGVGTLVDILTQGAKSAPGRTVGEIKEVLSSATKDSSIAIAEPELDSMAANLALHDLEQVIVVDGRGEELARIPVANRVENLPAEDRSDNVHLEPEDSRRPGIS